MQSADGILKQLWEQKEIALGRGKGFGGYEPVMSRVDALSLIRARDREIVEACKEAVIKAYDGSGRLRNHKAQLAALDILLRDLG